jgi:hypothetical protein
MIGMDVLHGVLLRRRVPSALLGGAAHCIGGRLERIEAQALDGVHEKLAADACSR